MDKILSVIIPAYNMEKYLSKCLDSLIIEDGDLLQKLDVIIVNDGSRDRTSKIAHEFRAKHPGVFCVIDKPNGNYGSCINAALAHAVGVFVKVLDADDSFDTAGFQQYLGRLRKYVDSTVDLILTDYTTVNEKDEVIRVGRLSFPAAKILAFESSEIDTRSIMYMHAITYRVSVLRRMGYRQSEGISYTDNEWLFLPMTGVRNLVYEPVRVYRYLTGRAGQTTDVKVLRKSIWMYGVILERMADGYARVSDMCSEVKRAHLRFVFMLVAGILYRTTILSLNCRDADARLKTVDQHIKACAPALHALIGESLVAQKAHLAYVEIWRKRYSSQTACLVFYRCALKIMSAVNSIRRKDCG